MDIYVSFFITGNDGTVDDLIICVRTKIIIPKLQQCVWDMPNVLNEMNKE